jgi:peptide/nickel transport system permease protein
VVARYAAHRLVQLAPTLFIITLVVFLLIHLIPGDPVLVMLGYASDSESGAFSRAVYDATRARLGLDLPIPVQYATWLGNALRGDLGDSLISGQPVASLILQRLPATLYLALAALLLAVVIAIPAGVLAAVRQNTVADYGTMAAVIVGISVPNFWLALILILVFSIQLRWLPTFGYADPAADPGRFLQHIAMPAVVLGVYTAAQITRFVRAEFLEQLGQDYVRTARLKGLPERVVLWKHVLKNSLVVTTTAMGFQVIHLLGGSTVVETVFAYPGVSYLLLQSIYARDFPIVQGVVLFMAITVVLVNFAVDLTYRALDPRVRYE